MHTGPRLNPIRHSIVGTNELEYAYDYIRFFLVFTRLLGLRKEKADGSMFDIVYSFGERFEYLDRPRRTEVQQIL